MTRPRRPMARWFAPGLAIGLAALISGCGGIFSDTPHRPLYQLKPAVNIGVLGQQRKIAAERQPRNGRFYFAGDRTIGIGSVEIGIERLNVTGTAAAKEQHDRAITDVR